MGGVNTCRSRRKSREIRWTCRVAVRRRRRIYRHLQFYEIFQRNVSRCSARWEKWTQEAATTSGCDCKEIWKVKRWEAENKTKAQGRDLPASDRTRSLSVCFTLFCLLVFLFVNQTEPGGKRKKNAAWKLMSLSLLGWPSKNVTKEEKKEQVKMEMNVRGDVWPKWKWSWSCCDVRSENTDTVLKTGKYTAGGWDDSVEIFITQSEMYGKGNK